MQRPSIRFGSYIICHICVKYNKNLRFGELFSFDLDLFYPALRKIKK